MVMIVVNKIEPFTCEFFDPENKSLGFLNDFEFNDLRIQIKNEKGEGYYAVFDNKKLFIDADGRLKIWPKGFYDMFEKQLSQLI